jgi:hypothetical protein
MGEQRVFNTIACWFLDADDNDSASWPNVDGSHPPIPNKARPSRFISAALP